MAKFHLQKNWRGESIETPEQALERVAECAASPEKNKALRRKWADTFYNLMSQGLFIPNTPTLANAGLPDGQLSACFVLPVKDSMAGIFDAIKYGALVHKSGGGTGYDMGVLREHGALVHSTNGIASGPLSFMKVFDQATDTITQGGVRRGANMGTMDINHPDIIEFIMCKDQSDPCEHCKSTAPFSNFNLSVKVTDEFMEAVERGDEKYPLISRNDGTVKGYINPRDVFKMIATQAWKNGEPGLIFIDRMNEGNPTPKLGLFGATNPCGEQPLLPFEACNLGSINLAEHVSADGVIDLHKLDNTVRIAVRFLDNIIDASRFPVPEIQDAVRRTRKIGLGFMGFADALILMGIVYGSPESIELAESLQEYVTQVAFEESCDLAFEKGPFPAVEDSIYAGKERQPRNASRTTIAPTGTISRVMEVSSGIEPLFGMCYTKHVDGAGDMAYYNMGFLKYLQSRVGNDIGTREHDDILEHIKDTGSIQDLDLIPQDVKELYRISSEIHPDEHLAIQAAFQKHLDNACSKTVIFPLTATVDDIYDTYMKAWKFQLKGLTVYRADSRTVQAMSIGPAKAKENPKSGDAPIRKRDTRLCGVTSRIQTGCGKLYVTLNEDETGYAEIFAKLGKSGGCAQAQTEAIGKLASVCLRAKVPIEEIIDMLSGIRCSTTAFTEYGTVCSCADGIARLLRLETGIETEHADGAQAEVRVTGGNGYGMCPECGNPLNEESGCATCYSCGFSRCG